MADYDWKSDKLQQHQTQTHPVCDLCGLIIWGPVKFLRSVSSIGRRMKVNGRYHPNCAEKVKRGHSRG